MTRGNIVDIARHHAAVRSGDSAFVFLDSRLQRVESLTFGELDAAARAVASALREYASVGDTALLLLAEGAGFLRAFLGCLYAGVVAVPCYPPQSRKRSHLDRIACVIKDTGARLLITDDTIDPAAARMLELAGRGAVLNLQLQELRGQPQAWVDPYRAPDDVAFLQYTSGSTSSPKGVCITHANIIANQVLINEHFGHDERTVGVSWLPRYHDMGLVGHIFQPLYLGVRSVLMAPLTFTAQPVNWLRAITQFGATTSGGPNFAYQLCVDRTTDEQLKELDLSSWRVAYVGAEPVRAATLEAFERKFAKCGFRGEAFCPCYGLAEATLLVSSQKRGRMPARLDLDRSALAEGRVARVAAADLLQPDVAARSRSLISAGRVLRQQQIAIVDPATGALAGPGCVGEVWYRDASVARGYWGRGEESEAVFNARLPGQEWSYLRTGDLGFEHEGELYIVARLRDLIIIRGRNYSPEDVEATAESGSVLVQRGASAAFAIERGAEPRLVTVHEVKRGVRLTEASTLEALREIQRSIAEQHLLAPYDVLMIKPHSLPRTSSGKVQRSRVRELYEAGELQVLAHWRGSEVQREEGATEPHPRVAERRQVSTATLTVLLEILGEILGTASESVGARDNFFELGCDSVALARAQRMIETRLGRPVSMTDLFAHPNAAALAAFLDGTTPVTAGTRAAPHRGREPIAIIGSAGRFPGAASIEEFWRNLRAGTESIRQFTDAELLAAGVPGDLFERSNYVKCGAPLENMELFDADYFKMTPQEASCMDPQQRVLLECAVTALESAGYPQELHAGRIGVFVGKSECFYKYRLTHSLDYRASAGTAIGALVGLSPAYVATLISYHLRLTGPSVSLDTACSTSLVAVHEACKSLLAGECEIALAGGVSIDVFGGAGYLYEEGGILSPDGHCRTFSADAAGTIRGSGVGLVVLRRLSDALAARDSVQAVIIGSATNNDGRRKVGFTAPSVEGQAQAIAAALAAAGASPESIGLVESHGTGTQLGDPIEFAALKRVYGTESARSEACAIGSLKTNIGHLDAAAGIAGLIKTVECLRHGEIPPSLNFSSPNPALDIANSPFFVNTQLRSWPRGTAPRRGAVSAYGIGGTNAHVVLQEAPAKAASRALHRAQLCVLSARNETALRTQIMQLQAHVAASEHIDLADLAYTLQVGREHHPLRWYCTCLDRESLLLGLAEAEQRWPRSRAAARQLRVGLVFPGTLAESQRLTWQRALADCSVFRQALTECETALARHAEPAQSAAEPDAAAQPHVFAFEYALARLLMSFGIEPAAMIGHGAGEYVAACLAGVLSLPDAARLAIAHAARRAPLPLEHEMHGAEVQLGTPCHAFMSNLTRAWITAEQATDPSYWVQHATQAARCSIELETLRGAGVHACVRIGAASAVLTVVESAEPDASTVGADEFGSLLECLGELWSRGLEVQWEQLWTSERRSRIALPTYPFQRQRYWVDGVMPGTATATVLPAVPATVDASPRTAIQGHLCALAREVLGKNLELDDDFFAVGGNSLVAVQFFARLQSGYHVPFTMGEFLEQPTIRAVAARLELAQKIEALSIERSDAAESVTIEI